MIHYLFLLCYNVPFILIKKRKRKIEETYSLDYGSMRYTCTDNVHCWVQISVSYSLIGFCTSPPYATIAREICSTIRQRRILAQRCISSHCFHVFQVFEKYRYFNFPNLLWLDSQCVNDSSWILSLQYFFSFTQQNQLQFPILEQCCMRT